MDEFDGFECLGFKVICDYCNRVHNLPAADLLEEAKADMKSKGLVSKDGKHYCDENCYRESKL